MTMIKKLSPKNTYFILSISGILIFFVVAFFLGSRAFDWIAMENNSSWAMSDYYRHVFYALNRFTVYEHENKACFPPLAYMFYYFIGRITNSGADIAFDAELVQEPYYMMVFLAYSVSGVVILIYAISELKIKNWQKKLLAVSLIFSTPLFAGALERGNLTLYAVGFLLIAMKWRDSESRWKKEAALILIAVSAGIKIYPAFFGILYLKEKRYREAGRLMIYGVLFFSFHFSFLAE